MIVAQPTLSANHHPQIVIAISRADVILVMFNDDSSARKTRASNQAGRA
jgi:hypothetical protein